MGFAIPLALILGAAALLVLFVCAYLLIYRAHVNRALRRRGGESRPMAAPHSVTAACAVLVLAIVAVASYFIGYKTAYDRLEGGTASAVELETFTIERPGMAVGVVEDALESCGMSTDGLRIGSLSLDFMDGEFSGLRFTAWAREDGMTRQSRIEVNYAGQLFEQWSLGSDGGFYDAAVPYETFCEFLSALDGCGWDDDRDAGFVYNGPADAAEPNEIGAAYVLRDGALAELTEAAAGRFYLYSFISPNEYATIYVPA